MNFTKQLLNTVDYLTKHCTLKELEYSFNFNREICNINPDQMNGDMFTRLLSIALAMYYKWLTSPACDPIEEDK